MSPDGNYILTSCKGFNGVGCETKVNQRQRRRRDSLPPPNRSRPCDTLCCDRQLWDKRTWTIVREYKGHDQDVVGCLYLPATASESRNLYHPSAVHLGGGNV